MKRKYFPMLLILVVTAQNALGAVQQETFKSPEDAVQALAAAADRGDFPALNRLFGPSFVKQVSSGDQAADKYRLQKLSAELKERHQLVPGKEGAQMLEVGRANRPFPAPLVKKDDKWRFDGTVGAEEVINRRIGENELRAINVARFYVDAQRLYRSKPRGRNGQPEYARLFVSSPGKTDGLYWPKSAEAGVSPMDPLVVRAMAEGYTPGRSGGVYQGYRYRILTKQGAAAPGGAKSYISRSGRMTEGFALLAYPARWGVSGVMSFMVSNEGVVYQKNLGKDTESAAAGITQFNPDQSWEAVAPEKL